MPIHAECPDCSRVYKLADDKAGKKIRCKDCSAVIEVRAAPRRSTRSGRAPSGRRTSRRPDSPPPRRASPRRTRAQRGKGSGKGVMFGAIGGGMLLCLLIGLYAGGAFSSGKQSSGTPSSSEAGLTSNGVSADDLTEDQKNAREAEYKASLEEQRRQRGEESRNRLVQRFGANRVVTIRISGVVGDTDAAHKYLNRKIFRAAYKEYESGRKQASQRTAQNKKSAEDQAVNQHREQWGEFGPAFVQYRYQVVESDVPYPGIVNAGRQDNTFTYHAAPASNVNQFSQLLGLGAATVNGREIAVQAQLPTPIPDPDVEEMVLQYGADKVVKVIARQAEGDPKLVELYLKTETQKSSSGPKSASIIAMKALGGGNYEFYVAPIPNRQVFGESLTWGTVENLDEGASILTVAASLPERLPTKEELLAAEKAQKDKEKAITDADRAHRPRPGEAELDWAVRVIVENDIWAIEKSLTALGTVKVNEDRRDEVSRLLQSRIGESRFGLKHLLPAMMNWRTDETEAAVLRMVSRSLPSWDRPLVMEALVELGTPACAEALASALPDFFSADESVRYLIDIGPVAEESVLRYLKHQDAKVRGRVYTILMEIGTSKSVSKLRTNVKLERDASMKTLAEACMEEVRLRAKEVREAESAGS